MIVMKFGGTSVGSAERIRSVASIVQSKKDEHPVVVVSAVTKITDALITLAKEVSSGSAPATLQTIKETHSAIISELGLSPQLLDMELKELESLSISTRNKTLDAKTLDHFQSFGERMSCKIVAAQLSKTGTPAQGFPAWELGMITDDAFGNAEPLESSYAALSSSIKTLHVTPVITGFIGKTTDGRITTLGRGGSDYTGAIVGAAIGASAIEIWTDVSGIMTTDPRLVPGAKPVPEISFEEACELAYFGAKVLHPKTILPAMRSNIPVFVLNTFHPGDAGTKIVSTSYAYNAVVKAFSFKKNATIIHIKSPQFFDDNGLMAQIYTIFDEFKKSIDIISTSVVSVSLTIDGDARLDELVNALRPFGDVVVEKNKAIVCVVGGKMNAAGVAGKMFTLLGQHNIPVEMISQASSGISITFVVNEQDAQKTLKLLHDAYI